MMMTDVSSRIGALEWNDKTAIHSDNALETASGYVSTGPTTQVGCAITAPGHCRSIDDGTLEAASTSTAPTTGVYSLEPVCPPTAKFCKR